MKRGKDNFKFVKDAASIILVIVILCLITWIATLCVGVLSTIVDVFITLGSLAVPLLIVVFVAALFSSIKYIIVAKK